MDAPTAATTTTETDVESDPARFVTDVYLKLLREAGYRPKRHPRRAGELFTVLSFNTRQTVFLLCCCEDDPEFFLLGCEYQLCSSPYERAHHVHAANVVNDNWKGVKVVLCPEEDTAKFTVETFLTGNATPQLLERAITAVLDAAAAFFAERRPPKHLDA